MPPTVAFVEHQPTCPPAALADWLGLPVRVHRPYLGESLPEASIAGLVILGGSMSALDDYDWFAPLADLIRERRDGSLPTLGVCLGHQLIGAALGARVVTNPSGPNVGPQSVGLVDADDDPLLHGLADGTSLGVHWNDDIVAAPPDGSRVVARDHRGDIQALRHGPAMWGVQWHPEATQEVLRGWADKDAERLRPRGIRVHQAVAEANALRDRLDDAGQRLARAFAALV